MTDDALLLQYYKLLVLCACPYLLLSQGIGSGQIDMFLVHQIAGTDACQFG